MRDDRRFGAAGKQVQRLADLRKFLPACRRVGRPPHFAVAHTRQIEGDNIIIFGKERRDESETAGVRKEAMGQQKFGLFGTAPTKIMHLGTIDVDEALFAWNLQRGDEPFGQMPPIACP